MKSSDGDDNEEGEEEGDTSSSSSIKFCNICHCVDTSSIEDDDDNVEIYNNKDINIKDEQNNIMKKEFTHSNNDNNKTPSVSNILLLCDVCDEGFHLKCIGKLN